MQSWRSKRVSTRCALACAGLLLLGACGDDNENYGSSANPPPVATATRTQAPVATNTQAPAATNTVTQQPTGTGPAEATPTPTSTPTESAAENTPTNTPGVGGEDKEAIDFVVSSILPAVASLADLGSFAGSGAGSGGLPVIDLPPVTTDCPDGGQLTFSCSTVGTGSQTMVAFDQCRIVESGKADTLIDGDFEQNSPVSCITIPIPPATPLDLAFAGSTKVVDLQTNKTLDVTSDVTMTAIFAANGDTQLSISGSASEPCLGTADLETLEDVLVPANADCATAGRIRVSLAGNPHDVGFTSPGGVEIDLGANGSVDESYDSCLIEAPDICD